MTTIVSNCLPEYLQECFAGFNINLVAKEEYSLKKIKKCLEAIPLYESKIAFLEMLLHTGTHRDNGELLERIITLTRRKEAERIIKSV